MRARSFRLHRVPGACARHDRLHALSSLAAGDDDEILGQVPFR
jgi:hypothetical protein